MNLRTLKSITFVAIIVSAFGLSSAFAQAATPEGLVKDLYRIRAIDYPGNSDRIFDGKNRNAIDKYFAKTLADYIWNDATSKTDEIGALEFDPFYEGQDAKITKLVVGSAKINGEKATVIVKFLNFNEKKSLTYKLIKQNSGWKISDIKFTDGGSLLQVFIDDKKARNTNK